MTREYYLRHKKALENEDWVPFDKLALYVKNALEAYTPRVWIQALDPNGRWTPKAPNDAFRPALIYRVDPTWGGPAEEPKPTFVDIKPYKDHDGDWMVKAPDGLTDMFMSRAVVGFRGCMGFIYNRVVCPALLTEEVSVDGKHAGYHLVIPEAVRFIKP
jgi:hypothetical protein